MIDVWIFEEGDRKEGVGVIIWGVLKCMFSGLNIIVLVGIFYRVVWVLLVVISVLRYGI